MRKSSSSTSTEIIGGRESLLSLKREDSNECKIDIVENTEKLKFGDRVALKVFKSREMQDIAHKEFELMLKLQSHQNHRCCSPREESF